ncbi:MAG TPA: DUF397 domain-containing protein [Trebonia sp.]|nr:DUF397 domain-containing protein [Trebonia sp.]
MGVQAGRNRSAVWRKSKRSGDGANCVEVASSPPSVLVRDSRDRSGTILALTMASWRELTRRIRNAD